MLLSASFKTTPTFPTIDEPGQPGKPEVCDYDNTSATLQWAAPESDGGRPISHYTVEMKNKFQTDWVEVAKTDDPTCLCKVPDLKERMVYQFRVRAHNKAGASKPSEPTDNHLCKHKNRKYFEMTLTWRKLGKTDKYLHNSLFLFLTFLSSNVESFHSLSKFPAQSP